MEDAGIEIVRKVEFESFPAIAQRNFHDWFSGDVSSTDSSLAAVVSWFSCEAITRPEKCQRPSPCSSVRTISRTAGVDLTGAAPSTRSVINLTRTSLTTAYRGSRDGCKEQLVGN